ncbi:MAG TPA: hypothetical protein VFO94_04655, partial [Gammaproteobacteria bacterium]|nr:hypothetical protein [Gammaproteobacteria bacterium]
MSAVARVFWTFLTALPLQRWLGGIMLVTVALGALGFVLRWPLFVFAIIPISCYVLATTLVTGYLSRLLSAPRTHGFLPYFRVRMLGAVLLVVLLVSAPALALLAAPLPQPRTAGLVLLFLTNYAIFFVFFPEVGTTVLLLLLIAQSLARRMVFPTMLDVAPTTGQVLLGWAACWTVLAVAYLRAPVFAPYRWPPRFEALDKLNRRFAADAGRPFTRGAAFFTWLTGTLPWDLRQWGSGLVLVIFATAALAALLRAPNGFPGALLMVNLAVLPIMTAPAANITARRAKLLWLPSGKSRRALFASVESNLWLVYMPRMLVPITCIAAAMGFAFHLPVRTVGGMLLVWAASTPLGAYLGLAATRGIRLLEVAAAVAFVASVALGTWAALTDPQHTGWLARVTATQVAATVAVRAFAIFRWQRLDWLEFR